MKGIRKFRKQNAYIAGFWGFFSVCLRGGVDHVTLFTNMTKYITQYQILTVWNQ
jgi:hypothetical protein